MKLNIGSGEDAMEEDDEGVIYVDDLSDWTKHEDVRRWYEEHSNCRIRDANDLGCFDDEMFDEVASCRCLGKYVENYDEIARVMKKGGRIWICVWKENLLELVDGLTKAGIEVTNIDTGNWDDGWYDYFVEGKKQ